MLSKGAVAGADAAAGGIKIAVQFPGSADINPVQYVQGLAKAVAARGGRIFEHSRVKVTGDNKCIGAPSMLVSAAWALQMYQATQLLQEDCQA